ncbi:MAG: phosphate transport system substrate-binding protein [Candidatus Atribacteria bacterium]|nr:phosphate transport system substrate-binding protein [Candidatus Atribacteria bacterium]
MKKVLLISLSLCFILSLSGLSWGVEKVDVQGSTTVLPIMQIIAEEFMAQNEDIEINVGGGGSGVGISSLLDGVTNVAMASRQMKEEEWQKAKDKGLDIREIEIAKDALSVIVNSLNPISEIDIDTLQKIYIGEINTWQELGVALDGEIVVISRDTNSGTFEVFNEHVLKGKELTERALRLPSNQAVLNEVVSNSNAIGYVGLGYVEQGGNKIKALVVNGVEASPEKALSGEYPLSRGLYLYVNGEPQGAVKKFIDFVLSAEGQAIVEEEGFIPLSLK